MAQLILDDDDFVVKAREILDDYEETSLTIKEFRQRLTALALNCEHRYTAIPIGTSGHVLLYCTHCKSNEIVKDNG